MLKQWKSEGKGEFTLSQLGGCGENVVIEDGVRIFHPENIYIGDNVYIYKRYLRYRYFPDEKCGLRLQ